MHIRDFLRGGYKDITEPTIITKHGRAIATWIPYDAEFTIGSPPPCVREHKRAK